MTLEKTNLTDFFKFITGYKVARVNSISIAVLAHEWYNSHLFKQFNESSKSREGNFIKS